MQKRLREGQDWPRGTQVVSGLRPTQRPGCSPGPQSWSPEPPGAVVTRAVGSPMDRGRGARQASPKAEQAGGWLGWRSQSPTEARGAHRSLDGVLAQGTSGVQGRERPSSQAQVRSAAPDAVKELTERTAAGDSLRGPRLLPYIWASALASLGRLARVSSSGLGRLFKCPSSREPSLALPFPGPVSLSFLCHGLHCPPSPRAQPFGDV